MGFNFSIRAGLLGIEIAADAAAREDRVALKMVAPGGGPVKQKLIAEKTGQEVQRGECGRGVESAGKLIEIPKEELDALTKHSDRIIDLLSFVPESEIDPLVLESSYYLRPKTGAEKAYSLIYEVLRLEGKVGIGRATMSGREHLVLIRAGKTGLVMYKAFYETELKAMKEFRPDVAAVKPEELAVARQFVQMMTVPRFDHASFVDEHTTKLRELVAAKTGGVVGIDAAMAQAESSARVADLMKQMEESIAMANGKKAARAETIAAKPETIPVPRETNVPVLETKPVASETKKRKQIAAPVPINRAELLSRVGS